MFKNWTPAQILASGFLVLIFLGTILLILPFSSSSGESIGLTDALFTSVSSVCVTGLIVKDTPVDFSLFGQMVIMLLIQIGGLGYMTSATVISLLLGKRIGLTERLLIKESLNVLTQEGIIRFTKNVIWITIIIEGMAAVILSIRFSYDFSYPKAIYFGVFHAISAFNNAGFSLFSDNLSGYRGDLTINIMVIALIMLGGIGFIVFSDIYKYAYNYARRQMHALSLHSKLTLTTSLILILFGAILLFIFEAQHGISMKGLSIKERLFASLFHSVSARTAGFNTVNIGSMANDSLFMLIILMVIGGSPGSTAGGLKTTTFALMITALWATFRGHKDATAFGRRFPVELIGKAFLLTTMVSIIIIASTISLLLIENRSVITTLFEVASAFGTVGYSVGDGGNLSLSALFSNLGKIIISITMYVGRLGPLLLGIAVIKGTSSQRYRYPEEKVLIG